MPSNHPSDPGLPVDQPTKSFWQHPPHNLSSHQSPILASETSVVIIGSGITGTSIAYNLLNTSPSLNIVMLEARTITSGATGRNGGHCKDVPYRHYRQWKSAFGVDQAKRLVRFRGSHVEITGRLARELHEQGFGDGQFRNVESVTAVFDPIQFRTLKEDIEDWLCDFPEERKYCTVVEGEEAAQKKYGIIGASGILTSRAAALWPYRLITGLLSHLLHTHKSFSLEALTPVRSITAVINPSGPFRYQVHTPRGTILTKHIIHCTNGHASHLLPSLRNSIIPVRGQMTTLRPPDTFPRLGHSRSWSLYYANGGFDYMTQAAGESGEIFLGGGVEQASARGVPDFDITNDAEKNGPALEHLCTVIPRFFVGGVGTVLKQAWTGIMGFTPDGFPIVGRVPAEITGLGSDCEDAEGGQWVAAGFNGYGMVQCWQSGRAIADMLLGVPDKIVDEYFPGKLFECSKERLERMNVEDLRSVFHRNVPAHIRSHL